MQSRALFACVAALALTGMAACGSDSAEPETPMVTVPTSAAAAPLSPSTLGDDPVLDELWVACDDGDMDACDRLYIESPLDSEYEAFGATCGDRGQPGPDLCVDTFGARSTAPPSATDPQPTAPSIGGASQADAICIDAAGARDDIPVTGSDSEDFASEEFAVSQIMFDAADRLAGVGASELADTMEAYAQSRADLAVAYDQELIRGVDDASIAVDAAADRLAIAASDAGAFDCVALAES